MIIMLLAGTVAFAQHGEGKRAAWSEKRYEKLKTELSLNDDQSAKFKAIDQKYMDSFRKVRSDSSLTKENKKAEMKKLRDGRDGEIKGVLTADQYKKWQDIKAQNADKRKHRGPRGRRG